MWKFKLPATLLIFLYGAAVYSLDTCQTFFQQSLSGNFAATLHTKEGRLPTLTVESEVALQTDLARGILTVHVDQSERLETFDLPKRNWQNPLKRVAGQLNVVNDQSDAPFPFLDIQTRAGTIRLYRALGFGGTNSVFLGKINQRLVAVKILQGGSPRQALINRNQEESDFLTAVQNESAFINPRLQRAVTLARQHSSLFPKIIIPFDPATGIMVKELVLGPTFKDTQIEDKYGNLIGTRIAHSEAAINSIKSLVESWESSLRAPHIFDTGDANFIYFDGRWYFADPLF